MIPSKMTFTFSSIYYLFFYVIHAQDLCAQ
nr:MAG TPA: hypothetical protein [Caudoviricetes sp.]DAY80246.1 MAG TPA: hypothetical protein [Caudoviricetes sp.]